MGRPHFATRWKACSQWKSKIPSKPAQVNIVPVFMSAQKRLCVLRHNAFCAIEMKSFKFTHAYRSVIAGLLEMETDWHCSGAVFLVRKPLRATT